MQTQQDEPGYRTWWYLLAWAGAVGVVAAAWYLAQQPVLVSWRLPMALGVTGVAIALVMFFFMHLGRHPGSARLVVGVAVVFIGLAILLPLIDIATRFPAVRPPGVPLSEIEPGRPAPTRAVPQDFGPPPPHRLPGH